MKLIGISKGGTAIIEANESELRFMYDTFAPLCGHAEALIALGEVGLSDKRTTDVADGADLRKPEQPPSLGSFGRPGKPAKVAKVARKARAVAKVGKDKREKTCVVCGKIFRDISMGNKRIICRSESCRRELKRRRLAAWRKRKSESRGASAVHVPPPAVRALSREERLAKIKEADAPAQANAAARDLQKEEAGT